MVRGFSQVDVFTSELGWGNPVAVIHDAEGMTGAEMLRVAQWTNLSETTFLTRPSVERADYGVRIFTCSGELPFAGHPPWGRRTPGSELAVGLGILSCSSRSAR